MEKFCQLASHTSQNWQDHVMIRVKIIHSAGNKFFSKIQNLLAISSRKIDYVYSWETETSENFNNRGTYGTKMYWVVLVEVLPLRLSQPHDLEEKSWISKKLSKLFESEHMGQKMLAIGDSMGWQQLMMEKQHQLCI